MNSTADAPSLESQELVIAGYASTQVYNYLSLTVSVIVLFDYLITFDREVHFAWSHRLSWAKCVFFLNRYFNMLEYLVVLGLQFLIVGFFSCVFLDKLMQVVQIVLYATWAAFSGIRVYAVSARSWSVTLVVVAFAMVPVVTNTYYAAMKTLVAVTPDMKCMNSMHFRYVTWTDPSVIAKSCIIISDMVAIAVTWMSTWSSMREARKLNIRTSFTSLVFMEGTVYFIAVQSVNVMQIAFTLVEFSSYSFIPWLFNGLTPILISRFFLDLHDLDTWDSQFNNTSTPTSVSGLRFVCPDLSRSRATAASDSACEIRDVDANIMI